MARKVKVLVAENGLDKRLNGYYSTPREIADFIAKKMIEINPAGRTVFDPCVGKEELLDLFFQKQLIVDSIDICKYKEAYKSKFTIKNFFDFYREYKTGCVLTAVKNLSYDFYIANPPYNCHEVDYIQSNKSSLKDLFKDVGVANTYSMFISAIIDMAKQGAVIGLVTCDSFLNAIAHSSLREKVLNHCAIHYLLLCPSNLFWNQKADVRTCILVLEKKKAQSKHAIKILNRLPSSHDFFQTLKEDVFESKKISDILLLSKKDKKEFVLGCPDEIASFFKTCPRISDEFQCVTGISTGNDKKYIRKEQSDKFIHPFYKNPGSRKFFMEPDGYLTSDFMDVEKNVKNFMVRNKDLLFKEGITCSSMGVQFGACYLPANSTYGVNANIICDPKEIWWLLSYLNSSLVQFFVRGVLIRTNMVTSGYVGRIPVVTVNEKLKVELGEIARRAYEEKTPKGSCSQYIEKIDELIFKELGISDETVSHVKVFSKNVLYLT